MTSPTMKPGELLPPAFYLQLRWLFLFLESGLAISFWANFDRGLPLSSMLALVAVGVVTNLAATLWARSHTTERLLGPLMAIDLLILAGLMAFSGGPTNPFAVAMLLPVVLGATLLGNRWAWFLTVWAVVLYGALFQLPEAADHAAHMGMEHAGHEGHGMQGAHPTPHMNMQGHFVGMWVAFALMAPFLTFTIQKIRVFLADAQIKVQQAELMRARSTQLTSLATLAAGAAHELRSPLSSIKVVAADLQHEARNLDRTDLLQDAAHISREVDRCSDILWRMTADAAADMGEGLESLTVEQLVHQLMELAAGEAPFEIDLSNAPAGTVAAPRHHLMHALQGIVRNARQASEPLAPIHLTAVPAPGGVCLEIRDEGTGMSQDQLLRALEPFYTTKGPGRGMGLGLFYAQSILQRIGGDLRLSSVQGEGTTVHVHLPLTSMETP